MVQTLSQIYMHIVFHVNLNREVRIPAALQPRLHAYLSAICKNHDSPSIIIGGADDHVHVLCYISKTLAPSKLLEELKSRSSKWMKTQAPEYGTLLGEFSWQNGYGVFSVSASKVDSVKQYIANQIEHHRKRSFKDEYRLLLDKHNVDYDERYLWS